MGIIYEASGEEVGVEPRDGKYYSLNELQAIVGGYIEMVHLPKQKLLICNEDGRSKGLERNRKATALFGHLVIGGDFVGDVLVCQSRQLES